VVAQWSAVGLGAVVVGLSAKQASTAHELIAKLKKVKEPIEKMTQSVTTMLEECDNKLKQAQLES